jgi:hypothetical protein
MADVLISIVACGVSLAAGVIFADKIKALFKAKVAEVTADIKEKL